MTQHPTIEDLSRWRRGEVGGEQVLAIGAHLASCNHCAQRFRLEETAHALCDEMEGDDAHPDVERDLFAFVDGTATREQRAAIEGHLAVCPSCAETVADLRAVAARKRRRSSHRWPLAVAASIAIAVVSGILWTRRPSPPPSAERPPSIRSSPPPKPVILRSGYARAEWDVLVDRIRSGSPIGMPSVLRSVRSEAEVLRGDAEASTAFAPTGVIVKTQRPELTWPWPDDGQSVVQIFRDDEEIARSGVLTTSRWRPERSLARGATYTWQVRVSQAGRTQILPSSPTPVARFHVVDAATLRELESAERHHAGDHLLLGILHARAGLDAEARAHLRRVTEPRDAAHARRILGELDAWRTSR